MGRGILSGLFWGSIISVFVLGAVSQLAPMPPRPDKAVTELGAAEPETSPPSPQPELPDAGAAPDTTAAETPPPETPASSGQQTLGETVSVPAGSEFRRPPPETEAALPMADPTLPAAGAPAVPSGDAGEGGLELALTESAARPETPGMSVTAPVAPDADETAPEVISEAPDAGITRPGTEPLGPVSGPSEEAGVPLEDGGLPPPVTAETVTSETLPDSGAPTDTLAPTATAEAETAAPVGSQPLETAGVQPLDSGTEDTIAPVMAEGEVPDAVAADAGRGAELAADTLAPGAGQPVTPGAVVADPGRGAELAAETLAPGAAEAVAPTGQAAPLPAAVARAVSETPAVDRAASGAAEPITAEAAAPVAVDVAVDGAVQGTSEAMAPPPVPSDVIASDAPDGLDVVPGAADPAVREAEQTPAAKGEQLAMADLEPDQPGAVGPERIGLGNEPAGAAPTEPSEPLPASPPEALADGGDQPDRPERKEIERSKPGEPAPEVGAERPSVPGVRVLPLTERPRGSSRLPQIGREPDAGADAEQTALATAEPDAVTLPGDGGQAPSLKLDALSRYAVPFSNPDGKPLFSVILIDDGTRTLDRQVLSTFTFPVTFAIDPALPDAAEAAAFYRSEGFEVVALATGLTANATARDLEVALEANLSAVPQAVAILDPAEGGFGSRRALAEHAVEIAAEDGQGLIGWDRGLGAVRSASERAGRPAAMIFRSLDDMGERSPVIRRYLDRAAFKAVQDGAVVMAGHAKPETVEALFSWSLDDKASQVALAPVSAVLRAR